MVTGHPPYLPVNSVGYKYFRYHIFIKRFRKLSVGQAHRRRMEREAKAKVVASVWGADFIQFLAALSVLPRPICK